MQAKVCKRLVSRERQRWLCALKRTLEKDAACLPAMTLRLFSPAHRYSLFKGCFVLAVVLHEHFLDEMVHGLCE